MGTTTRSRGTSIPRTVNSYGDEPNDSGDVSAPAFRRTREPRGARRHEEKRLPGRVVDVPGAVRRRVRQPGRGGGRCECAQRAHGHLVPGDAKIDSVLDWYRRDDSGQPMPAEWRNILGQIQVPWTAKRPPALKAAGA